MITYERTRHGHVEVFPPEGESVLLQSDWDQTAFASLIGGGLCKCGSSDGTVQCDCGTVDQHMAHAQRWLESNEGDEFEDPGYFDG